MGIMVTLGKENWTTRCSGFEIARYGFHFVILLCPSLYCFCFPCSQFRSFVLFETLVVLEDMADEGVCLYSDR